MKFMLTTCHTEDTSIVAIVDLNEMELGIIKKRRDIFLAAKDKCSALLEHNYFCYITSYYENASADLIDSCKPGDVARLPDTFNISHESIWAEFELMHIQDDGVCFSMFRADSRGLVETLEIPYEMLFETAV